MKRKPDEKIQSADWVRLQCQLQKACTTAVMAQKGRFEIKYWAKRCQMRANHGDSKSVFHHISKDIISVKNLLLDLETMPIWLKWMTRLSFPTALVFVHTIHQSARQIRIL